MSQNQFISNRYVNGSYIGEWKTSFLAFHNSPVFSPDNYVQNYDDLDIELEKKTNTFVQFYVF